MALDDERTLAKSALAQSFGSYRSRVGLLKSTGATHTARQVQQAAQIGHNQPFTLSFQFSTKRTFPGREN
jgi:hypothetical protein